MPADDPTTLVSTDWLAAHLGDPDLRVLDASFHLPDTGRDARAEYAAAHIPGARFFDIDEIADTSRAMPHMAPPPEKFISRMRAMGVGDGHQVVVYDGAGMFSAPRTWWTFRLMGKTQVAVLDGGLPKWRAEGRPVEDIPPVLRDRHITVQRQAALVREREPGRRRLEVSATYEYSSTLRTPASAPPHAFRGRRASSPRPRARLRLNAGNELSPGLRNDDPVIRHALPGTTTTVRWQDEAGSRYERPQRAAASGTSENTRGTHSLAGPADCDSAAISAPYPLPFESASRNKTDLSLYRRGPGARNGAATPRP